MTSANKDSVNQSVKEFKSLEIDERLATLALIYNQVASALPSAALGNTSPEVSGLVKQIDQMSKQEQVDALRDILPAKRTDQDEVTLDPNPSKALAELVKGGTTVPTHEYGSMSAESKLAFWYQLGQKLGKTIVAIPTDYHPSDKATDLFNSLKSLEVDQQLSFLSQVV